MSEGSAFSDNQPLSEIIRRIKSGHPDSASALLRYLQAAFPQLSLETIELRRSPLSLNSVNGIVSSGMAGGGMVSNSAQRYFFKMHSEEGESETLSGSEYYQAQILAEAGYPVIEPLAAIGEPGKQAVLYPEVTSETAFDYLQLADVANDPALRADRWERYLRAERDVVIRQREIFLSTLERTGGGNSGGTSGPNVAWGIPPLHQLFYNRLVTIGKLPSRLTRYYEQQTVPLPQSEAALPWDKLLRLKWRINGRQYSDCLGVILETAKTLLNPRHPALQPSVIGHGDEHNGNKFLIDEKLWLFDPAFAGRQPALLSFIKATAHNVFLHPLWFYTPTVVGPAKNPKVKFALTNGVVNIEHNYDLARVAPERLRLFELYLSELWHPLLEEMRRHQLLHCDWQKVIARALACCVLLTKNLIDDYHSHPEFAWLGLSRAIELGNLGIRYGNDL